jgi:hypothetical protein
MKSIAAISLVLLGSTVCSGEAHARTYWNSGNELYRICESPSRFDDGLCIGIVVGTIEMYEEMGGNCPYTRNVTKGQARDVVMKFLRDHPQHRHLPASWLIVMAIEDAFFCRPPSWPQGPLSGSPPRLVTDEGTSVLPTAR